MQVLAGWTFEDIDAAPAWRLDRLLAVDKVVADAREEMARG